MAAVSIPQARILAQELSGPQRDAMEKAIADAERKREKTVDIGWLKPLGAPPQLGRDIFISSTAPAVNAKVEKWLAAPIEGKSGSDRDQDIGAGDALLRDPALSTSERAQVKLRLSGLIMQKADSAGIMDKKDLATRGFETLKSAYELSPKDPQIVEAYAKTIANFAGLNRLNRFFVKQGLGLDIDATAKDLLPKLKEYPDNASIQLVREKLAEALGDKAEQRLASGALSQLPQDSVAGARAAFNSTAERAAKSVKD